MSQFEYFIVLAEMRTGSNFLEANLNAFEGIECHGEAFNPSFVGYPNTPDLFGITHDLRERNPFMLLEAIKTKSNGIGGFRFFSSHDDRILETCLNDPRCAKIVLLRNPIESYVSLKIARATDQWKLTNAKHLKKKVVDFDASEFEDHLEGMQEFQVRILNALQKSGQTAFYIAYEDLQDVEILNGLARYLGCETQLKGLDQKLKKQNPESLRDKVGNFKEMENSLAALDRFNLYRTPNFEPRRGPVIPTFYAASKSKVLFMPLRGGPVDAVKQWMADLDEVSVDDLKTGFKQKSLRQWKATHPGHRSFTVLRHPVARAHAAFCDHILATGPGSFFEIRKTLKNAYNLPIPMKGPDSNYTPAVHRTAFIGFLEFLKSNLARQTGIRVDPSWASQLAVLQGMSTVTLPDLVLREEWLREDLAIIAAQIGMNEMPPPAHVTDPHAEQLSQIYDSEIEAAARAVYQKDYVAFGFANWR